MLGRWSRLIVAMRIRRCSNTVVLLKTIRMGPSRLLSSSIWFMYIGFVMLTMLRPTTATNISSLLGFGQLCVFHWFRWLRPILGSGRCCRLLFSHGSIVLFTITISDLRLLSCICSGCVIRGVISLESIAGLAGGLGESTIMGEASELFTFKGVFRVDFLGSAGTTLVLLGASVPEA